MRHGERQAKKDQAAEDSDCASQALVLNSLKREKNRQLDSTNIAESLLLNETNFHYFCTCLVIVTSTVNANVF